MSSKLCRLAAWTALTAASWLGAPASAQERVELHVERSEGARACPSEEDVRREVTARLGYDPFRATADRVVHVLLRASGRRVSSVITITREGRRLGRRMLGPDRADCAQLTEDLMLALTIAIDPVAATRPAPAPPGPAAAEAPEPTVVAVDDDPPLVEDGAPIASDPEVTLDETALPNDASPNGAPPLHVEVGLAATGQVGSAPLPTLAIGGSVALVHDWMAVRLGLRGSIPVNAPLPMESMGVVDTYLLAADLDACGRLEGLELCVTGAFGALVARASGLPDATEGATPYVGVGASVAYVVRISESFGLRPSLRVLGQLVDTHVLVGDDVVWALGPVGGTLALEVFFRG